MTGKIAEVFASIQGEGPYLGQRQQFVRFFGCNLSCKFCDTPLSRYYEYTPDELASALLPCGNNFHSVSFTGGEPLMQKDFLKEILSFTHSRADKNYLETNGTLPDALEEVIDDVDIVSMDLKLPSSTLQKDFWQLHRDFLRIAGKKEVFVKAVICRTTTEEDLNLAIRLMRKSRALLVLQPNSREDQDTLQPKLKAFKQQCLKHGLNVAIIPQMHKILGMK